ncbi:hypothetical protein V8E53_003090 [Lactarius tabidus]
MRLPTISYSVPSYFLFFLSLPANNHLVVGVLSTGRSIPANTRKAKPSDTQTLHEGMTGLREEGVEDIVARHDHPCHRLIVGSFILYSSLVPHFAQLYPTLPRAAVGIVLDWT